MKQIVVAGVDGCAGGWIVAKCNLNLQFISKRICENFEAVIDYCQECSVITVDIPVGIQDAAEKGGRECDRIARKLLSSIRGRSVFSAPARPTLAAKSHKEAIAINRSTSPENIGISAQCYNIISRIIEVDNFITPENQSSVREIHPEMCFYAMNGNNPVVQSKHTEIGVQIRLGLLEKNSCQGVKKLFFGNISCYTPDDLLDACAAAWTAVRICRGEAVCIPETPEVDSRGLRMEMWY